MKDSSFRIQRRSLASQVRIALSEDIASGALAPGERILIEQFADRLGVSVTPVREAIVGCVQDGLIRKTANGKLEVVPLTQEYVSDVFLVRGALEGLAAELAATRLSEAELASLRQSIDETMVGFERGDFGPYVETDALLHGTVASSAGSAMLSRELEALQTHIAFIRAYAQRRVGEHMRLSHREHCLIVDALERRDSVAARSSMEQHIRDSGSRIAKLIQFDQAHT